MSASRAIRVRPLAAVAQTTAEDIGRAAMLALHDELALAPKPGLVSFADSGSHDDMDARTFQRSLLALRPYFSEIAQLGAQGAHFAQLQACGLAAEQIMLRATGGVNTHRGAIFMLGLLCAGAGAAMQAAVSLTAQAIRSSLTDNWGDALRDRAARASALPGGIAAARYGLRGAADEAAAAFPTLFTVGFPALEKSVEGGDKMHVARLDALFSIMAVLDDCNLASRGGIDGLTFARDQARKFLLKGGSGSPGGIQRAQALHREFVARRLSPGGVADTVAAACFLWRVSRGP